MSKEQLTIVGAEIRRPTPVPEAAGGAQRLLFVEVENPSDKPLHVWASRRGYDYDASAHVLTIYLTDPHP